jgi:hypothetical protein
MSRELLKEAIADAKAVKEAAIANAKAALEEAFTPHLKELLASKLESLDESEDQYEAMLRKKMEEEMEDANEMMHGEEEKDLEELDLEEILAELEDAEGKNEKRMNEAKKDDSEEESEEDEEEKSEKKGDDELVGEMTEDDLKKLIMSVFDEMGIEAGAGGEGGMEDLESDVMAGEEAPEEGEEGAEELEEIDLEELMLEMEMEKGSIKEFAGQDALINALEIVGVGVPALAALAMGLEKLKKKFPAVKNALDNLGKAAGGAADNRGALGGDESSDQINIPEMQDELNEAYSTIKTLRSDLNEVNLLNAKLLYTNKIFKAKNLTESQKVKVLSTFDKATTVKEVKLVFESLSTSIAASNNTVKAPIKESMGFASKASGIVKNNQTIETNAVIARMKKLAGL